MTMPLMAMAQSPGIGINKIDTSLNVTIGSAVVKFKSQPYYGAAFLSRVNKAGDTMTGNLTMTGGTVFSNVTPISANQMVRLVDLQGVSVTPLQVTGTTQTMIANYLYVPTNTALTTFTLPTSAVFGQRFQVVGDGSGGWKIAQNAGQQIVGVNVNTTAGTTGSVASQNSNCTISLIAISATRFKITSSQGSISIN